MDNNVKSRQLRAHLKTTVGQSGINEIITQSLHPQLLFTTLILLRRAGADPSCYWVNSRVHPGLSGRKTEYERKVRKTRGEDANSTQKKATDSRVNPATF